MGDDISADALVLNLVATAVAVTLLMLVTFVCARRLNRHSVVDVAWGMGFTLVGVVSAVLSSEHGDPLRTWLLCAITALWGLRLSTYIASRNMGQGEDPRYADLLSNCGKSRDAYALRVIYGTQGFLIWFVSLPVQVASYIGGPSGWLVAMGLAIWLLGFAFESIGDAQLARFKANPANRGKLMTRGLWAWTRHPNYFGDACVWWGIYLVAADSWVGACTVPAPLLMTWLLTRGSGKRLLEQRMSTRPGWSDYTRRTSGFLPLPPRG